jgi:2-methylfumaryl-CoA isomerase
MPGTPLNFSRLPRSEPLPAPLLGEHTDEILAEVPRLSDTEIGRLHDAGVVADARDQARSGS